LILSIYYKKYTKNLRSKMKVLLSVLLVMTISVANSAVPDLPLAKQGFTVATDENAVLVIDAFWDPLCPDTLAAIEGWTAMNATMDWTTYAAKLNIVFFPLTYHRNSFEIAWGAQWLWATYQDP
jgi:hypothetical protein